ncbi:hypothetical protein [Streptomyces sp. NPDC020917]|uniref:hypothetical protein n=1 Tax=Streptomyces sp. NPDC020917 TaxID=3365102 RepID=UPI0037BAC451
MPPRPRQTELPSICTSVRVVPEPTRISDVSALLPAALGSATEELGLDDGVKVLQQLGTIPTA